MPSVPPPLQPTLAGAARRYFPLVILFSLLSAAPIALWQALRSDTRVVSATVEIGPSPPDSPFHRATPDEAAVLRSSAIARRAELRSHTVHPELTAQQFLASTDVTYRSGDLLEVRFRTRPSATGAFAIDQLIGAFAAARRERIAQLTDSVSSVLDAQLAATRTQLSSANELVRAVPDDPGGLTAKISATTRLSSLQSQRDAIVLAAVLESNGVTVVDPPHTVVQVRPFRDQLRSVGFAGAAGCLAGMAVAWVLARRRPRIEAAEQVEQVLGVPILARVPHTAGTLTLAATHVMRRVPHAPTAGRMIGVASTTNGSDPGAAGPISLRLASELAALSGNGTVMVADDSNVLGDHHDELVGSVTVLRPAGRSVVDTVAHARFCSPYTIVPLPALPTLEASPRGGSMFDHVDAVVALVDHHSLIEDIQHAREALLLTGIPLIGFIYLDGFRVFG